MRKNYCRTETVSILGTTLCCHCGEEVQVTLGHPHKHQDDEDYCTCSGSMEELEMRKEQSKLKNKIHNIDCEIEKLLRKSESILSKKSYELEINKLDYTLRRKYGVEEDL